MAESDRTIACRDGCGRTVHEDDVESSGWEYLPIQKRYRCVECWRQLKKVNERSSDGVRQEGA